MVENRAKLDAYQAQMAAYRQSPEYLAYQEAVAAYQQQRMYEAQMQDRARTLARNPATGIPGDPCSPPPGGVVGKFYFPVPRSESGNLEQRLQFARMREGGCQTQERLFDLENMEVCCPPGVEIPGAPLPPAPETPPVTNGNGSVEPKRYFGFTATQLMIGALGGIALYALLKR